MLLSCDCPTSCEPFRRDIHIKAALLDEPMRLVSEHISVDALELQHRKDEVIQYMYINSSFCYTFARATNLLLIVLCMTFAAYYSLHDTVT